MPATERERRYQAVLDSISDTAIIAVDRLGQVSDWNIGAETLLGWTAQEVLGQPAAFLFIPDDLSTAELEGMAASLAWHDGEQWYAHKDKTRVPVNASITPISGEDGEPLGHMAVLRHRTGQAGAKAAHDDNAAFLRGVLAASGDCIKILDLDANLTFMSEGGQAVMEVDDFSVIAGCPWPDFWEGDGNVAAKEAVKRAKSGSVGHFRGPAPTMRGTPRWWDVTVSPIFGPDGKPARLLSISRDVTERQIADELVRTVDKRWHDMFDRLAEGFILGELVRDDAGRVTDWRYVEVNPAWGELVGVPHSDAVGKTIRQVFPGIDDAWIDEMRDVVLSGQPTTFTREVGTIGRWYEGRAFPMGGDRFSILFFEVTVSRAAEEQLKLSELEFRTLAQAIPNQAWTATPDGNLTWFNDRVFVSSGLTYEELEGSGWAQMVHPDDLETAAAQWGASLASGEIYEVQLRLRMADGSHRWHLVRATAVKNAAGEITRWVGTNTDVETQKASEVASTEDRDRLWALSQDLMLVCGFDGVITAVNPTAKRLLGWEVGEMVGHSLVEFLHPDDLPTTALELEKLATGATTLLFENRYRTRDGSYRLLDWSAVPDNGRVHAVGRDVTMERALARDRERIWTISPVVAVVATIEGDVIAVNPSWTSILGWSEADTVGRNIMEFVAPEDRDVGAAGMALLAAGTPVIEFENVFLTHNGERRRIAWTTVPEDGTLFGFGRDITSETEAAKMLAATEDALRQSQKMEAVGQLTGGIAHDFNNLLTGITGSLELLQKRVGEGRLGEIDKYINGAQGAARRAAALTHRLLAFSRRQTLEPKPTAVNALISGMHDLVSRTVGPEVEVEFVGGIGLWNTLVDPSQLENALLNLCINARDAMPDGGKLTIETANRWLDVRTAAERDLPAGQYISLCVSDTGSGMSAETIEKVFEPFFTTKPIGMGTGLGLSMIYGFAKQSLGQVRIYSELGQGTTVCLYLPRYLGDVSLGDLARDLGDAPRSDEGETVLVIDDEPSIRMLAAEILRELGYIALEASDGPSGLKILNSDARVDLLVTDVGLPGGLNGRQVADAARAVRPNLNVLFITGYAENAVLSHGHLDPGMHIMTKPFTMDALARRISELIEAQAPA